MTALSEDKVLRLNCPGFGVSGLLPLGEAKPLAMYDVIIVNPTSILHLFDNKSEAIKKIELLQSDGMTSYSAESDSVIESVLAELDLRTQELQQFLRKGGLLIFFLVPPFTIKGPTQSIDNYSWLGELAPDKPGGPNQRNMSATIRGKAIDPTTLGLQSAWLPYLKQANLEWSTIIRSENLAESFTALANAGPNKCIAGIKSKDPEEGQIVFLPAPYDSAFNAKLKECLDAWHEQRSNNQQTPSAMAPSNERPSLTSLLSDDVVPEPQTQASAPENNAILEPAAAPAPTESPANSTAQDVPSPEPIPVSEPAAPSPTVCENKPNSAASEVPASNNSTPSLDQVSGNEVKPAPLPSPEAQELIQKMKNEITRPELPEWCSNYSFSELDQLKTQLSDIDEEIQRAKLKAQEIGSRIERITALKNDLLSAQGEHLKKACTNVFERLGWSVQASTGTPDELWLLDGDTTQAIVRINFSCTQTNRSELASLAESLITYWGAHEVEPKGVLIASTWADRSPLDRPDEDFSESMNDFARRKNLCMLTTMQLLSIYRDLEISELDAKTIRDNILTTSGQVPGYHFDKANAAQPAAAATPR